MTKSYSLRFENGERRGETVPIAGERFTVGRKPGNSLQIVEGSVSGKHAELVMDAKGMLLRDLGSTNGTRVGDDRIIEMRVRPGAVLSFGNVRLTLLTGDAAELGAGAAPAAPGVALDVTTVTSVPPVRADEASRVGAAGELEVSAEMLARARKGSKLGLLVMLALLLVGGGTWWTLKDRMFAGGEPARPVPEVRGNLLAEGFSFEDESFPWTSGEGAPASFLVDPRGRFSGSQGLVVDLGASEWAISESQDVRATRGLRVAAELRVTGAASALLGIQFSKSGTSATNPGPVTAWSEPLADTVAFETVELVAPVPAGYDRARVILRASASQDGDGGSVYADDVRLVEAGTSAPTETVDEYKFYALGAPPRVGVLFKVDRVLFSGLELRSEGAGAGRRLATLVTEAVPNGIQCKATGLPGGVLVLRVEPAALDKGLATTGEGGYSKHGVDFDDTGVTDVLVGGGGDLVRFRFDEPVTVKGRKDGAAFRLQIELGSLTEWLVQLKFREEHAEAVTLAARADDAERRGRLGECMLTWRTLLSEFPYEDQYVGRAIEVRTRLIRQGLDEVRGVAGDVERARFFSLVDLFRQCRDSAEGIARRYAGSEVEQGAKDVAAEIDQDLLLLEAELDQYELGRLRSILAVLEADGATELAQAVQTYMGEHFGGR
ncbi:MAG: FHA domain-containing protein [Planctomycetota bacterium]|nr:MAG: FHA domain-containing protein [Planctomycetota bacterium]